MPPKAATTPATGGVDEEGFKFLMAIIGAGEKEPGNKLFTDLAAKWGPDYNANKLRMRWRSLKKRYDQLESNGGTAAVTTDEDEASGTVDKDVKVEEGKDESKKMTKRSKPEGEAEKKPAAKKPKKATTAKSDGEEQEGFGKAKGKTRTKRARSESATEKKPVAKKAKKVAGKTEDDDEETIA